MPDLSSLSVILPRAATLPAVYGFFAYWYGFTGPGGFGGTVGR